MTPQRWRRLREVLDGVFELPPGERQEFIDLACDGDRELQLELESLIRSHESAGTFLDLPAARLEAPADLREAAGEVATPPARIGGYQVLDTLGQGGMGTVYLATRADGAYRQQVAVKVLQGALVTAETVRRFRSERQILANLEHPAIAKLLDGGSTRDGRPFLVMEYVDGVPIDRFCRERALAVDKRLELFCKVCRTVHFAHQNLVVHRDLKPGNILIDERGEPKLLDFGIAKLLAPETFPQTLVPTAPGAMPMTPEYASPEQVNGDVITTASDVYTLGVLLYELLAGRRPYPLERRDPRQVAQAISRQPLKRPSTAARRSGKRQLGRRLKGDLDNIVIMALSEEPQRRYGSAEQLARDVERHLSGLPVRARGDSFLYRAGKFAGRHKLGVATALGVFGLLMSFLLALLVQRGKILDERDRAAEVSDFLVELFEIPDPHHARGEKVLASDLLRKGAREIGWQLEDRPAVQAELLHTMGRSYMGLGLFDEAETLLTSALDLRRRLYGTEHPVASSLQTLGDLKTLQGDYARGEALLREALALHRRHRGEASEAVARSLMRLARILDHKGELEESERHFREAIAVGRGLALDEALALALDHYSHLLIRLSRYDEAEALLREAIGIYRGLYGEMHPESALGLAQLAALHEARGDYQEAEALFREAEAVQRQLFEGAHPHLASTLNNLADLLRHRGRYDEASELFATALEMRREIHGEEHPQVAWTLYSLAGVFKDLEDRQTAERLHREALEMRRQLLGDEHPDTAASFDAVAQLLSDQGETEQAEELYRQALEIRVRAFGEEHRAVAATLNNLADLAVSRHDHETAEELYRRALAISRRALGPEHPNVALGEYNLASLLHRAKKHEDAETHYLQALATARLALGERHVHVGLMITALGLLKNEIGEHDEAEPLARQALSIFAESLPEEHSWTTRAQGLLGASLLGQGRYGEAEPWLQGHYRRQLASRGAEDQATVRAVEHLVALYEAWPDSAKAAKYRTLLP